MKASLERLKERNLIDRIAPAESDKVSSLSDLATLTETGAEALDGLLEVLPLSDRDELGDELKFLVDLASDTTVTLKRSDKVIAALRKLLRGGHVRSVVASDDPIKKLKEEFALDDVVELTRMGARLLGLTRDRSEPTKKPVPLVFPFQLFIENGEGEVDRIALPLMPRILDKDYQVSVDLSTETLAKLGHSNPFIEREWTYVFVMYDPADPEQTLTKQTKLFHYSIDKGETSKRISVTGEAFSLFLIPLDDRSAYEILKEGEGTVRKFEDDKRFRDVLSKLIELGGAVKEASPLDLDTDIGKALLKEIGLDAYVKKPAEIMKELKKLEGLLKNGKLPEKLESGALEVVKQVLRGLTGTAGLIPLNILVNSLGALRWAYDLEHEHHFELLEMDAEVNDAGTTLLRVKPQDVARIRLDKNTDGPGGKDLRQILAYPYRPIAKKTTRLGLIVNDGKPSLALVDSDQAVKVPSISVGDGGTFVFEHGAV